ncbi:MAG: Ribokinase [uncultured Propionibacteriaceae bacterium]|uniref:Ribokinase n=1 Tax=uncultured Propionibacteriaceae bacterium TaxID=257457 RepID=A0A6J4P0L0_9ACTN|nr:MAG: Ribokinase [uncultured Propionibacteriaceae bacterium]
MTRATGSPPVIVVGSANQDYIYRLAVPPGIGETVLARSLLKQPGGKGANQAVAAARLHGNVSFVACVGDDDDGASLIRELRSEGVDTSNVEIIHQGRTGLALVAVYDSGDNAITVIPGSNFSLTAGRVSATVSRIASAGGVMVVQAELQTEIIGAAIRTAEDSGVRAIFNLAPYQPLPADLLAICDPLVVNETEASSLVGWPVRDPSSAARAAKQLRHLTRSAVITLGAAGAYFIDRESTGHVPAPIASRVVDTTGAGDAFVGALATFLARGESFRKAVHVGVLAGTFAVGSPGAQSSYPTLADLNLVAPGPARGRSATVS